MPEKVSDVIARSLGGFEKPLDWEAKYEARKAALDAEALKYLHAKFPDADESIFFTAYRGIRLEHVVEAEAVCDAASIDYACGHCGDGGCLLPEQYRDRRSRPVVSIENGCLSVRWTRGIKCHNPAVNGDFVRMFQKSRLVEDDLRKTFGKYEVITGVEEARRKAWDAANGQNCLVIAGKTGTGKTHLAVAIAIYAMRQGRQAMFFDVCELLDELREASRDNSDRYYELMRSCKEVPCLVLDDMGKERTTAAGMDYLYQIVNHRYRHNLQTILTTNASDFEELSSWSSSEYVIPMISRLTGRGAWVTIKNAEDYRQREVKESAGQR